ncbi:MAG: hypothetical protein MJK14_05295 [Rivularia sp. ALOHA_DT_140]|nr:hypothetical protein [Rivularia sp. ALOHA_DT_140]
MEYLGIRLAEVCQQDIYLKQNQKSCLSTPLFTVILRNIFFLIVVIIHGFRRLLPPY